MPSGFHMLFSPAKTARTVRRATFPTPIKARFVQRTIADYVKWRYYTPKLDYSDDSRAAISLNPLRAFAAYRYVGKGREGAAEPGGHQGLLQHDGKMGCTR